jgi:threonine dehydrogenase-like Zn-dependent dehydrogenase
MKAAVWRGTKSVKVEDVPMPLVTDPLDALIRVTLTTICGSDLHLYHHEFSGMEKGDILGHEFMGIVEQVGPQVQNLQIGDRVVVSAIIADGRCDYCQKQLYSCCDRTNPSKEMEKLYGHRTAGLFGYSHLTGGYEGGQAEYVRVPYADVNCLKVPPNLRDEQVLFLSDVMCTGWHANELAQVSEGQTVAVWGCGPVGLMAQMWAKFRGARRVIAIDCVPKRLEVARDKLGCEIINFSESDVLKTMHELVPGGPDVCIDAVGFRFPKSLVHRFQRLIRLETDSPQILTECIMLVRKGGKIGIVGDYYSHSNAFPIGAFMEKGLTMAGGQVHVQKYWHQLLEYVQNGEVDPTFIISREMSLEEAEAAYHLFDEYEEVKILLRPHGMPKRE